MPDIWEYRTIIESESSILQIKGVGDSPPPSDIFWLSIKVRPDFRFCGETELYLQKNGIIKFINELTQMHKETKGQSTIKCLGWGSYLSCEIGKSGELFVSGLLNKRFDEENMHLRFKFNADQTYIPPLIQVLKEIITD
jgi:hypothetical protein